MKIINVIFFVLVVILGFSQCKKDPCETQYCLNGGACLDGSCICPTGFEGEHCEYQINTGGYICVSGNCTFASSGAQYSTLGECQNACGGGGGGGGTGGTAGYNCVSGNCNYVSSGAQYTSLSACQNACGTGGTAGYNCISGNCNYVSSGAQFASLSACQANCGTSMSFLRYINNTFTPLTITVNGNTKTAPVGGYAEFSGTPGYSAIGNATTSGVTNQGNQVGLTLTWDVNNIYPASGTGTINVNVSSNFFFLKIKNNGPLPLTDLYVNYGLQSQTYDNIVVQNDNVLYSIGYYKAFSNTNVRVTKQGTQTNLTWYQGNQFNLPWTNNQLASLYNNLFDEPTVCNE